MNIERIEACDFRSWRQLDLRVEPGVTLIQGANGAGKSSILDAVWFALFGATSDAGRLIRRGADKATVEVCVRIEFGLLRVERSIRRSGRGATVTLNVEMQRGTIEDPDDQILTAATVTETQAHLEELLGVSRETLMASAFSAQGDGASFCEAKPADRKRILGDVLGLGLWDELHARARAEALDAKRSADAARGALELVDGAARLLAGASAIVLERETQLATAELLESAAEEAAATLATEAEAAREARRQRAAAIDAVDRARQDHERATAERAKAGEALQRAKAAAANAPSVEDAWALVVSAMDALEEAQERHEFAAVAAQIRTDEIRHAKHEMQQAADSAARYWRDAQELRARLEKTEADHCPECGQELLTDEAKAVPERLGHGLSEAHRKHEAADGESTTWATKLSELNALAPVTVPDGMLAAARSAAQEAQRKHAEAETIELLAGSIDAFQEAARAAMEREMQTAETLRTTQLPEHFLEFMADAAVDEAEATHQAARATVVQAHRAHREAAIELARVEAAAAAAERDAAAETAARDRVAGAEAEAVIAGILAAGFGPQGVPALILENSALPALEAEANRVLGELNAPVRIELRSQKALRSRDDVADTLDIVVSMDAMEAPYETLSGGERTRVALALRAALTRLLASKRGARVRLLVVDEPAGLDSTGCEQLAQVLEEFVQAGVFETIILVTHQAELADQIARVVRVEKTPGGESRLVESAGLSASQRDTAAGRGRGSGVVPAVRTRDESHA